MTTFFDKEKALREKATKLPWVIDEDIWAVQIEGGGKSHYPVTWVSNLKKHKQDAEYIVFAANNFGKVCELLSKAMRAVEYDDYDDYGPLDVAEEIQAALDEMVKE